MGLAKTEMFTDQQNQISVFAKAFGHPARVAILQHLFKIDACFCGDLGLIKGTVEGTSVCYCIDTENWTEMKDIMTEFLGQDLLPKDECC